jgi:hypothetical protein
LLRLARYISVPGDTSLPPTELDSANVR